MRIESRNVARRHLAYSLAAGAVALCSVEEVEAEVIYSGLKDISIGLGDDQWYINLDLDQGDQYSDIVLQNYIFPQGNYQGMYVVTFPGKLVSFKPTPTGLAYVSLLNPGFVIDSMTVGPSFVGSLAYANVNPNAQFKDVTGGLIGLSFLIGGTTVNHLHFAWLRVDIDNAEGSFVLRDWAYEDQAGVVILAGDIGQPETIPGDFDGDQDVDGRDFLIWQRGETTPSLSPTLLEDWQDNYGTGAPISSLQSVPEPGTLGFLAAGSMGLALLRKNRRR
jgi:hypothetical protein